MSKKQSKKRAPGPTQPLKLILDNFDFSINLPEIDLVLPEIDLIVPELEPLDLDSFWEEPKNSA